MKKIYHVIILICVVGVAVLFINNQESDNTKEVNNSSQSDPYKGLRSDGTQEDLEKIIKNEALEFMNFNYAETTWFNSISAASTVINSHGKFFIVQSKSENLNPKAKPFVQGLLSYFNAKTLDKSYKVDKVILVDQEHNILFETEIVDW